MTYPARSFHEMVDASAGMFGCWPWLGNLRPDGYGRLRVDGQLRFAHRIALEGALGRPIRPGYCACHHCDNPPCVNPLHLFEGTNADNQRDKMEKGRCSARPALTAGQVALIRDLWTTTPMTLIAPIFPNVSRRTLYRVVAGVGPYAVAA